MKRAREFRHQLLSLNSTFW